MIGISSDNWQTLGVVLEATGGKGVSEGSLPGNRAHATTRING